MKIARKFTKYFSLLLVTAMLGSCGKIDPGADLNVDVSDHSDIVLETYFPAFGFPNQKIKQGWLGQALIQETTYQANYNQFSSAADTEANNLLNTKEPIDMMKVTSTIFNNYVTHGYFTDLTDVIEKYGNVVVSPDGTTMKNLFTKEQWDACSYKGRIYAIPEIGHTSMNNQALIWNTDHLQRVGIEHIPQTVGEFKTALEKLTAHFRPNNQNYYAFGLNGYISISNPISAAFDVPAQWYVDDEGKLQNMIMSDEYENYSIFMNELLLGKHIAGDWVSQTEPNCISNFVKENCSVYVGSYWNIQSTRDQLLSSYPSFPEDMMLNKEKKAFVYGELERVLYKEDALLGWNVYLKGDGTNGSPVQAKGKVREDGNGVGYYITVPVSCAKRAAYVMDWVCRKNTEAATILMIAGEEGLHFDYCQAQDEGAIKLNKADDTYVKLYDRYHEDIKGMSQFQTSVNCDIAREWWPVAENGFNAWNVLVVDENGQEEQDRIIENAFALHPVLPRFASVDLEAQNYVVTQAQYLINCDEGEHRATLENARQSYISRYYSKCQEEMNSWYSQNH